MTEIPCNNFREKIPCDNINLSDDLNDINNISTEDSIFASKNKYKNSIFYDQISNLIDDYEKISVADSLSNIDKDLLAKNAIALNEYLANQRNKNFTISDEDTSVLNTYSLEQSPIVDEGLYEDPLPDSFQITDLKEVVSSSQLPDDSFSGFDPLSDEEIPINFISLPFEKAFPNLNSRLVQLPFITTSELIDFYDYAYISENQFSAYITVSNPTNLLKTLDLFYSPNNISQSSMGSFCSLVTGIFAKFDKLKGIFNDIKGFVKDFSNLINSIRTFSFTKAAAKALIEALKKQVLRLVDKLIESVRAKITNFLATIGIDEEFIHNTNAIIQKISNLKSKVDDFFSELSVKNIKETVKALISYAAGTFENLDLEEAQFLILRFCTFIGEMERLFNSFLNPFKDLQTSYNSSISVLRSAGNLATAGAIAAGATRFDNSQISAGAFAVNNIPSSRFSGSETSSGNGNARSLPPRPRRVVNVTDQELQEITSNNFSYESVLRGNSYIRYNPGPQSAAMGSAGWNNVLTTEKVMLLRLAKRWGSTIVINSAWRTFGAENSWHKSGQAFDISLPPSRHDAFARMAVEEGFGGFGSYPTFIHIDSRNDPRGVRIYLRGSIRF